MIEKLLIIDLDNTLVATFSTDEECRLDEVLSYDIEEKGLRVYLRPWLDKFIHTVKQKPEICFVLFTAGGPDYVHAVIERLFGEENPFNFVLTRDNLNEYGLKSIKTVHALLCNHVEKQNVLFIDDNHLNIRYAYLNEGYRCIQIKPFWDDKYDTELMAILKDPFFSEGKKTLLDGKSDSTN